MNLRKLRREQGLTIKQLADKAGVAYVTAWSAENGENNPSYATLKKLAEALGVTVSELIGGK